MNTIYVLIVIAYSASGGRFVSFQEFGDLDSCTIAQHSVYEGSKVIDPRDDIHPTVYAQCVKKYK